MARTERVSASDERDAMVNEDRRTTTVNSAMSAVSGSRCAVPCRRQTEIRCRSGSRRHTSPTSCTATSSTISARGDARTYACQPEKIGQMRSSDTTAAFLKAAEAAVNGASIDPAHPKLRELVSELIDDGLWRLLWMPPTLPYWPLEGPFKGKERRAYEVDCCSPPGTWCRTSSAPSSATKRNG